MGVISSLTKRLLVKRPPLDSPLSAEHTIKRVMLVVLLLVMPLAMVRSGTSVVGGCAKNWVRRGIATQNVMIYGSWKGIVPPLEVNIDLKREQPKRVTRGLGVLVVWRAGQKRLDVLTFLLRNNAVEWGELGKRMPIAATQVLRTQGVQMIYIGTQLPLVVYLVVLSL